MSISYPKDQNSPVYPAAQGVHSLTKGKTKTQGCYRVWAFNTL